MKRFLTRKTLSAGLVIVGILAFAGTCTIQNISLTLIGSKAVFAAEIHNDTDVDILEHNIAVAFVDNNNSVLETKIVAPCLRTLPAGGVNYFSAQSTYSTTQVKAGLSRLNFDSKFKAGTAATGAGTITGLAVNRATTTLTVTGTFKNTDSTTLTNPQACAVVFDDAGNVIIVGLDTSLSDLALNATDTFSIALTVPNSATTVKKVNVYVDGYAGSVPIVPIKSTGNLVNLTPTPTVAPLATPGAAAKVAFTTQPPASTLYATGMANIVVAVQDAAGTTTTSTANVTIAITGGTGTGGGPVAGVLTCTSTLTVAAVSGLATFTGCQISRAGIAYSLTATSTGLSNGVSSTFNITPTAATGYAWTTEAGGGISNAAWAAQPVVRLVDTVGNTVWTDNTSTVTLNVTGNPAGVLLSCTSTGGLTKTVVLGVATFAGCKIDKFANGYTLTATTAGVGPFATPVGAAFNIGGSQILVQTQPSTPHASTVVFTTQPVFRIADSLGNTVTTDSASTVTLTWTALTGGPGTLACTTNLTRTMVSGVATFAGCNITTAGTYTITATSSIAGVTTVTTITITIT